MLGAGPGPGGPARARLAGRYVRNPPKPSMARFPANRENRGTSNLGIWEERCYLYSCAVRSERGGPPRYAQIAAAIRAQIIAGRLGGPGARVPSEPEIVDLYQVSKTTAGRALEMLAAEGIIERRIGTGSYVAERVPAVQVVKVPKGATVSARPARAADFPDGAGIPPGVIALVIEREGRPARVYPADRTILRFG